MMRGTFLAIITTLCSVSCSDWRFNIVNSSPYHFQMSNVVEKNNFNLIPFNLRPWTVQSVRIRFDASNNLRIEYGSRLQLYFARNLDLIELEAVRHDASISYTYDVDLHTIKIRATNSDIDKFSFIVSSDPQPYRLDNDGDPNAQRLLWLASTKPVFRRIAEEETDAHLMIVNGDLTEFGRTTQWKMFQQAASKIPIPRVYGLGNHDYANNVEDCSDVDPKDDSVGKDPVDTTSPSENQDDYTDLQNWSSSLRSEFMGMNIKDLRDKVKGYFSPRYVNRLSNLCARRMIARMRDHEKHLANLLPDFASDNESLAYAWNYGSSLRFVQLHNHLNYVVTLLGFMSDTVVIKSSVNWLIADMNTHKDRSYIINVHDAMEHSDLEVLRPYFGRIKAIFAGHTHEAGLKCSNGVVIFDSGALFKNEFLRVNFSQGGKCLDVLHFVNDKYVPPLTTNYCFSSILENPCK